MVSGGSMLYTYHQSWREGEIRDAIRPTIPVLIKMLDHRDSNILSVADSLLGKLAKNGEWQPHTT
jgi:hypothetical protein